MTILAALAAMSASALCQSIQRGDFWDIGDSFELKGVKADSLNEGAAGTGQTWMFNNLVPDPQSDRSVEIIEPGLTGLESTFPGATHVEYEDVEGSPNYVFYKLTDENVTLLGVFGSSGEGSVTAVYSEQPTFYDFPLEFGSQGSDNFSATFTSNGAQITRTGTVEYTCDGTGTLTVNGTTYENVLRLKGVQIINDVTMGFAVNTLTTSYLYFAPDDKRWPVFILNYVKTESAGFDFEGKSAFYRDLAGSNGSNDSFARMIPHMTSPSGGFAAKLIFWNSSSGAGSIDVTALDGGGSNLGQARVALQAGEIREVTVASLFPGEAPTHFGLQGSDSVKVVIAYKAASGLAATAHLGEDAMQAQEYWVYPGNWDLIFDGMALVNGSDQASSVMAELVGPSGGANAIIANALPANGKYLATFDSLFADAGENVLHIESDQPLAATFLKGTYLGQEPSFLYANGAIGDPSIAIIERWLGHITRAGGGFETDIIMLNTSSFAQNVNLVGYLSNGVPAFAEQIVLQPGELRREPASSFFSGLEISHMSALSSGKLIVSTAYRATAGQAAAAYSHAATEPLEDVLVFLGEADLVFDGMALVNVGNQSSSVEADLLDETGQVLETVTLNSNLGSRAKMLAVFGDVFSQGGGYAVLVRASQSFQPVFLRGTYPGADPAFLFANPLLTP